MPWKWVFVPWNTTASVRALNPPLQTCLSSARSNQLLQLLSVHPWNPRYDPASERNRTSSAHNQHHCPGEAAKKRRLSSITHMATPVENLASIGISTPFSSRGFSILKTARTLAMMIHTDVSAKYFPTHIRRPNPNVMCSVSLDLREPSSLRYRSGMNVSELGYLDSSCAIDLCKTTHQDEWFLGGWWSRC